MSTAASSSCKRISSSCIDSHKDELYKLSNEIWENPELGSQEYKAHKLLTDFLEKKGFTVECSFTGIETAFRATFGSGRPNVCVICEYDALPEIGHACGHNLIAEAGIAAGLGLKAALESSNTAATVKGMVTVMGTPAEEGGGDGKVALIRNGAFKDVDIAIMVHPYSRTIIKPVAICFMELEITYTGKAAHAAAFPWEGVNALDAAVMAYNSISVLRQQMKPTWKVNGVITNGGAKPNIIPEKTSLCYYIRTSTKLELYQLKEKLITCSEAAAKETGCQVEIKEVGDYLLDLQHNDKLAGVFVSNYEKTGITFSGGQTEPFGSTDMGNVSYVVPSIHPVYKIDSSNSDLPCIHTREFQAIANTPEAHSETLVAAKAMAHTCIDVLTTDGLLEEIRKNFEEQSYH